MAFGEIFNPGSSFLRDQRNAEKLLPPSLAVPGAPPFTPPEGIVIPGIDELEPFDGASDSADADDTSEN